jgi:hypothetical protein
MIEIPTVLVLGAGASVPYGFPSGTGLYHEVVQMDPEAFPVEVNRLNRTKMFRTRKVLEFKVELCDSGVKSVDVFLESRREFERVGKAAMACVLGRYEAAARGRPDEPEETDWYRYLWERMRTGVSFDDLGSNALSILTFNYDRSLEDFLFRAARAYYGKSPAQCAAKLGEIDIIHLHGSLGPLPWQTKKGWGVSYGRGRLFEAVRIAINSMKVVCNGQAEDPDFKRARELLGMAERVYFLGFGYRRDNISRLGLDNTQWTGPELAGTCYGLGARQIADIQARCPVDISVDMKDLDCMAFFRECYSLA